MCLENEPICFMQPTKGTRVIEPNLFPYYPLSILEHIVNNSGMKLCFDVAHHAASTLAEKYLAKSPIESLIFSMTGQDSWSGVNSKVN